MIAEKGRYLIVSKVAEELKYDKKLFWNEYARVDEEYLLVDSGTIQANGINGKKRKQTQSGQINTEKQR